MLVLVEDSIYMHLQRVEKGGKIIAKCKNELERDMKLLGCKKISELKRENLRFRVS